MRYRCASKALAPAGLVLALGAAIGAQNTGRPAQQPVFKAGVELIAIDAAVVDKNGNPVPGLQPSQFEVAIDGKPRRVVSADFLEYASKTVSAGARPGAVPTPEPLFSSNDRADAPASQGRLIFLAVDQGSFKPAGARGAMEAAKRFIDRLQPDDRVGLVTFPGPGPSVPASRERASIKSAVLKIIGSASPYRTEGLDRNVSLAEAIDIRAGDNFTLIRVLVRECGIREEQLRLGIAALGGADRMCADQVQNTAGNVARNADMQVQQSITGLESVIRGLARIRERKTLVLISAGLPVADRMGVDLQYMSWAVSIGHEAAAANLNFFVLHIDSGFLDAFSVTERAFNDTLSRDLGMMSTGLETIAGAGGGSLARVVAGADFAFDRVLRETAAAYVLGVEPDSADRDGKTHRITVKTKVPGAEVRSRREVMIPGVEAAPATPEDALIAAFQSPRQTKALRLRVSTARLAPAASGGNRVLVTAEIGQDIGGPAEVRTLYAITDESGRTSAPVGEKQTLNPRAGHASGSVSYTSQTALRPGSYVLRFAAADAAGRTGSVDHAFTFGLTKGDGVQLSDLVLLNPDPPTRGHLDVIIDGRLRGSVVETYLEVAPSAASAPKPEVTFGVTDKPDGNPLISVKADVSRAKDARHFLAGARLGLQLLPPGEYFATAIVSAGKRALGRVTKPIVVERDEPATGAAAAAAAGSAPRVSFAVGESGSLVKAFSRQDVLDKETIEYFVARLRTAAPDAGLAPALSAIALLGEEKYEEALASLGAADSTSLAAAFLKGLALFGKGDLEPAAAQFRASIDLAPDFLPAAFYLGACYAAGGRDREAVGAWQTALITESDARIVYDVLGDALLRLQDGDEAALLLGEARDKWVDDDRFVPRLAASEALRRDPKKAVAMLDGHIARHPADADALLLALRLLYEARSSGSRITSAADDAAAARRFADLYKTAGGPNVALAERWAAYVERK